MRERRKAMKTKKLWIFKKDIKDTTVCINFSKTFQGLGIMLSFDNPSTDREYTSFSIKFLWFGFWIMIYKAMKTKRR